jgi:hypothetical protein
MAAVESHVVVDEALAKLPAARNGLRHAASPSGPIFGLSRKSPLKTGYTPPPILDEVAVEKRPASYQRRKETNLLAQ